MISNINKLIKLNHNNRLINHNNNNNNVYIIINQIRNYCTNNNSNNHINNNHHHNNNIDLFSNRYKRKINNSDNSIDSDNNNNSINQNQNNNSSSYKNNNLKSLPGEQYIPIINEEKYKIQLEKSTEIIENHKIELNEYYLNNQKEIDEKLEKNINKKSFALCFGYDGTGYYGLSYNKDLKFKSIENYIEKALFKNGHIALGNVGDLARIKWSRSSRTDKGVHSLATLISCFILVDNETELNKVLSQSTIDSINKDLPDSIKLLSGVRVSKSFRARRGVCERTYHYMVPRKYLSNLSIDSMNEILLNFIGNFSFHNYTSQRNTYLINNGNGSSGSSGRSNNKDDDDDDEEDDDEEYNEGEESIINTHLKIDRELEKVSFRINSKNMRTIKEFYCEQEPIIINNEEWLRFIIKGESFITFQIRKMMGFFFAVAKGIQPIEALKISINSPFIVSSPTAPPFSLYLYEFLFDTNKKDPVNHKVLFSDSVNQFKKEFLSNQLYSRFNQIENESSQFNQFFNELKQHEFYLKDLQDCIQLNNQYQQEKEERLIKQRELKKEKDQLKKERLEREKQERDQIRKEKERIKYENYLLKLQQYQDQQKLDKPLKQNLNEPIQQYSDESLQK